MLNRLILLPFLFISCISQADTFTVGVEEIEYAPFYYVKDGQYSGFGRELFDKFALKYKHTVIYRPLPIERLYSELFSGKITFKFPDHNYWAQDKKQGKHIYYSKPVVGFTDGVLVLKENKDTDLKTIPDIGYLRGFTPWTLMGFIKENKVKSRVVNSLDSLIKLTLHNRIDGSYFNLDVAKYRMRNKFPKSTPLVLANKLPFDRTNYLVSSLEDSKLLKQLNEFLTSEDAHTIREKHRLMLFSKSNN
jgi:hypothetical protein